VQGAAAMLNCPVNRRFHRSPHILEHRSHDSTMSYRVTALVGRAQSKITSRHPSRNHQRAWKDYSEEERPGKRDKSDKHIKSMSSENFALR
jgi:hypothetical protein